jgi:drug/metabolite transporter (DMT)-like permease
MFYFIISLLLSVSLVIILKYFAKFNVNTFQGIAFNYLICVVTGIIFLDNKSEALAQLHQSTNWIIYPILLGMMFITVFNLTGLTAQRIGVTIAMVASKTSLIIPVLASLFFFKTGGKEFSILNYSGIALSVVAIVFTTYKSENKEQNDSVSNNKIRLFWVLLPFLVFIGNGACDTLANYTNLNFLNESNQAIFTILVFSSAFITGNIILLFRVLAGKEKIQFRNFIGGVLLGVPNYFSLYFMLKALSEMGNNGAFFFPIFNIGMILVTTVFAIILFNEKLSILNKAGVFLALMSILLISFEEIKLYLVF